MAFRSPDLVKQRRKRGARIRESQTPPKKKELQERQRQLIRVYQFSAGSLESKGGDWSDFAGQVPVHHH